MTSAQLLTDAFDRIQQVVHGAAGGLPARRLAERPAERGNSIAWLVWHLTRIQDDHVADAAGTAQVWTEDGWADRFGLPLDPSDTGYGHNAAQVAAVQVESADLLTGYHDAVHDRTVRYVASLTDDDLSRVVDRAWDPPVTLAVRLISVVSDDLQHAGQAAYVRGLLKGA
ncbi:mycothiol transferase [Spirillospora sp. CA-142024]|uniref:mycothiol transferase n=1 Tax=Spirillospora sp. CA-142024 TaxID=3240036 RepID=UPI003D8CB340